MVLNPAITASSRTLGQLVARLDAGLRATPDTGLLTGRLPTGFDVLDEVLGGGLAPTELTLLGGRPGVGKTIAALQWARTLAGAGHEVVFVCYEHSPESLLGRILTSEIRMLESATGRTFDRLGLSELIGVEGIEPSSELSRDPIVRAAIARLEEIGERLLLVDGNVDMTPAALERLASEHCAPSGVLMVDYLQRVPGDHEVELARRPGVVAQHLKELAKAAHIAVVAISSLDDAGMRARRVRTQHIAGPALIAYEADVILMLNAKRQIVSEAHIADDGRRLKEFGRRVVFSIEKNRSGESDVDLEFLRDFEWFRFENRGVFTSEKLVDEVHNRT